MKNPRAGARSPSLAYRALNTGRRIGLLPCNVVIRTEANRTVIEALDPADGGGGRRGAVVPVRR